MGLGDALSLADRMPFVVALTAEPVAGHDTAEALRLSLAPEGAVLAQLRARRDAATVRIDDGQGGVLALGADMVALPRADSRCHALGDDERCTIYERRPHECALFPVGAFDGDLGRAAHVRDILTETDFACDTGSEAPVLVDAAGALVDPDYRAAVARVGARAQARARFVGALRDRLGDAWLLRRLTEGGALVGGAVFLSFDSALRAAIDLGLCDGAGARALARAQSAIARTWAETMNPHVDPPVAGLVRQTAPSLRFFAP